jgi:2,5-diamino-6-(ribosylamino)-4(3H)-pyrimidinone 5'-phosphate reductase
MEKIGINEKTDEPQPIPCGVIIIDNKPHLTATGVSYLAKKLKKLILVTSNPQHPAFRAEEDNVVVISQPDGIQFGELFEKLKKDFGVDSLTVQSGGTLNATLLREGLIDHLSIVIAPVVVGGATTPTLVDGEACHAVEDLKGLVACKLVEAKPLNDSYLHLRYDVIR